MSQNLSRHGIGASEISAIAGMNPYASPWDVWLRKTGQAPEVESTAPMEWGIRLEPAIRQKYVDETKGIVFVPTASMFHPEIAWARATPDGIVVAQNAPIAVRVNSSWSEVPRATWQHLVQCKNVGGWVEKAWSNAPPVYVQLQEQWELYVTGLTRADVAVLIGGNEFRIYTIHRDEKMIGDLVTIAEDFWRRVMTKSPPPIDDSEACQKHFESKYAKGANVEIVADGDTERLFSEWQVLVREQKDIKRRIDTIRNVIRKHLAEAQATSLASTIGTASLLGSGGEVKTDTNWEQIAKIIGSAKLTPEEWQQLLDANTTTITTEMKQTLYAPRNWAKEQA